MEQQIKRYERLNKQTKDNLKLIVDENAAMREEVKQIEEEMGREDDDPSALYVKLQAQCEALELLSFLQYASEEELQALILKKTKDD